jgi:transposase
MESTGVYGRQLAHWLVAQGWQLAVVNPRQIKGHAQSMGLRTKTDSVDARCIADFAAARSRKLTRWTPPPENMERIRHRLVRREQLLRLIACEANAVEVAQDPWVASQCQQSLAALQTQLEVLDANLAELLRQDPKLHEQAKHLQSIPGIGVGTTPFLIELLGRHNFQQARQAAAFVGLTPSEHTSGDTVKGPPRLSKMGDPLLRKQLWWPAVTAMRHPDFASWVERLKQKGKANKSIICAIMRKLVHLAFGVLRSNSDYDKKRAFPADFA